MDNKLGEKGPEPQAPARDKEPRRPPPPAWSGPLAAPQGLSIDALIALQRVAGNSAVGALLEKPQPPPPAVSPQAQPNEGEGGLLGAIGSSIGGALGEAGGLLGTVGSGIFGESASGALPAKPGEIGAAIGGAVGGLIGHDQPTGPHADGSLDSPKPGVAPPTALDQLGSPNSGKAEPEAPLAPNAPPTPAAANAPITVEAPTAPTTTEPAASPAAPAPAEEVGSGGFDPSVKPSLGETVPPIPEPSEINAGALSRVGRRPTAKPAPQVGAIPAPPAAEQGDFERETEGIEKSTEGGGGGGLLDTVIQAAMSLLTRIAGGVAGTARSAAGEVGSHASTTAGQVNQTATAEATAVTTEVQTASGLAATQGAEGIGAAHAQAEHAVGQTLAHAKAVPGEAAGVMESVVMQVLHGAAAVPTLLSPFQSIFGRAFQVLPGLLTAALSTAGSVVNRALDRAVAVVDAGSKRLSDVIARTGAIVEGAIDFVAQKIAGLRSAAQARLGELPSIARNALSGLVDRLLGSVARAAAAIAARARRLIDTAVAGAQRWVQVIAAMIIPVINGLRSLLGNLLSRMRSLIASAIAAVNHLRAWLIAKAKAMVARAIRAIIGPLYQRAYERLMLLIGPEIQAAIERAQLAFPNGLPTPPEALAAVAQAGQGLGSSILQGIKQGLLNPEGDHFSVYFQWGGDIALGGGLSGGGGAQLEVVMDYRRNDIGFFVSPAGGVQGNVGDLSEAGHFSITGGWGTVASFGDPKQDVLQSWGGWFTNVSVGAQGGVSPGFGGFIATGDQFYRSGAGDTPALFSYTPLGADKYVVPGEKHPDTVVPGAPPRSETRPIGEVLFGTQKSDAEAAAGGAAAMDQAAQIVKGTQAEPGTTVKLVRVAGESSPIWVRPRKGRDRKGENLDLSQARADSVKLGMQTRLGGAADVQATGVGDVRAEAQGRSKRDNSPEFRRAAMVEDVEVSGTPDQVIPGGKEPDREEQQKFEVKGYPKPWTTEKTAWGWDTTATVGGLVGESGKLGGYAGAGLSYSFPIGKTHLSAASMEAIRQAFYSLKYYLDLSTVSPLGLLRDIVAHERVSVAPDAATMMTNQVTQWSVPMPSGVAAA